MSKSIVTNYEQYSSFSGSPAECRHHLLFGRGMRDLAEEDGAWIPLLNREHNMSSKGTINQIHGNPAAEALSKIAGQLAYERRYLAKKLAEVNEKGLDVQSAEEWEEEARESFRKRYGRSYL